ncbi:hypothetical protein [Methylophilus aquaticus]|uniref:DUF3613 domain-containing protein n=1 Tax=Methylophilus aquaticus TaxID=1971610 RepID=A0ABT9JWB4_9PROT|nr:hypothetical protein [Methylophilus aquaticus]MDP8568891.1 hypothetical protein [Methylophilus aquaticus]
MWFRFTLKDWMLLGLLACMVSLRAQASEDVTTDGRSFQSLSQHEVLALSAAEQRAYAAWLSEQPAAAPVSEGPNTMDMSSDFSM